MATSENKTPPKRPEFLTAWLLILFIVNPLVLIYNIVSYSTMIHTEGFTRWQAIASYFVTGLVITGALLVWKWRKAGLYLISLPIILNCFTQPEDVRIGAVLGAIGGTVIVYFAMRPAWKYFK